MKADSRSEEIPILPATRLVAPPQRARVVARTLTYLLLALGVGLLLLPWRQNVSGSGRVIAYAPVERQQRLDAPISGQVVEWFVREGERVKAGQQVAELSDNDPQLVHRLNLERATVQNQIANYEERVRTLDELVSAQVRARDESLRASTSYIAQAEQKVTSAKQKLEGAVANLDTAILNLERQRALEKQGLVSQRDLELAIFGEVKARTERESAIADLRAAEGDLEAKRADLEKTRADGDTKIESARAGRNSAEADLAGARAKLAQVDVKLARQDVRFVKAQRDGTILRILAFQGVDQVKQGDPIAILVPDAAQRAVEVWVDGNDAAIVGTDRQVRLQFEGWPAVQFAGWPSVAVGTFAGKVAFVDSTDDGKGNFRVVILPDGEDHHWPEARFLRQGAQAKAWILLDQVSLGFELWRRFNGFPPTVEMPKSGIDPKPEKKAEAKDDGEEEEEK